MGRQLSSIRSLKTELHPRIPYYIVLKKVTITLSQEVANWARKKAAEENTSVSRLVGQKQMLQSDDYLEAYRRWQKIEPMDIDAANRLTREDAHARR